MIKPVTKKTERRAPVRAYSEEDAFFTPFLSLHREINKLFENSFGDFLGGSWPEAMQKTLPRVQMREDRKAFHIRTALPVEAAEDVDVSITDEFLTIACHSEEEKSETGDQQYRSESACRTILLPETADASKAKAELKGNTLVVRIPKRIVEKARKIQVKKA